ncbi:helix-turn-helix transcriptional regulator [Loigolactobacillus coryniformis]|uniref:helix-turn-helix transcriptional regulator n=1 Tax=Loigolactobacillus coryniformis TaxID=1610 RepID=UPI001C6017D3|nr:PAS domain-containing protein [Loigolactobacillus coryniformis]MBW4801753.1 PAS domain-containing protein [Loigolactobacillus coryniformis subsp. torquens]MBW4804453.1 PAS domain-containing protein [Loigolactobacillus coryniformis subsp. torquens]
MDTKLQKYKELVAFLGQILSSEYEIVLHWLNEENSYYIVAIEHSEVSGRDLHSPITGFALQLVQDKVYEQKNYVDHYAVLTETGKKVRGATYFIRDDHGKLLGLLCINFDFSAYVNIADYLNAIANGSLPALPNIINPKIVEEDGTPVETLNTQLKDIIYATVDPTLLRADVTLTVNKKIEICRKLNEKGIFQIKGALPHVAEMLHSSESSIYRYLKIIERENDKDK